MKLSRMSTGHVLDVLTTLAVELEPILDDEKLMAAILELKPRDGETNLDYGMRVAGGLLEAVCLFGKSYRAGLYRILAALSRCEPEEIDGRTVLENWEQIKEMLDDEVLLGFFSWFGRWVRNGLSAT